MKEINDQFSRHSDTYKKYRPTYPIELYNDILALTAGRNECWDCGTGNGQVAFLLSQHFKKVLATDISENQISQAHQTNNISYKVERAESSGFKENQFDLITVAQAIHWFDLEAFNKEAKRVLKDGGIIAVWGYGLLKIERVIDNIIHEFYSKIVGPYWSGERWHIDDQYSTLLFNFLEIDMKNIYSIETNWTLDALEGYLNSWSSVQNYREAKGKNPVEWVIERLKVYWPKETKKEINFPIFTRIGRNKK